MNIAIYIDNRNIRDVDCFDLTKGNPGIGGTEYSILLLAQIIKLYKREIRVTLLAEKAAKLPCVDKTVLIDGLDKVASVSAKEQIDILIISSRREGKILPEYFFEQIESKKIKTIIWGHNYYYSNYCERIADCEAIKANVFVGRQQYDRYIDHRIIDKSTYIYNMYPMVEKRKRTSAGSHAVTYIGSLVPEKGFQILAAIWKKILNQVPDAELYVIGSGKLYSRNARLGKYGIAEENFEAQFMPNLVDENGRVLSSVHFLGVLGAEKDEVILKTGVGVVNPTGRTETFGISALDFESMGVPVVTIAKGGFLDTVVDHKTGILSAKSSKIADGIIELLKNNKMNEDYGRAGIELAREFTPERILINWLDLFEKVLNRKPIEYKNPNSFIWSNLKWLRITNRKFKAILRIKKGFSVIGIESFARGILRRIKS